MPEDAETPGYCGMYCGLCAMHTGEIRSVILRLKELISLYQLERVAQLLGGIESFPQFTKTLDKMEKMFGECPGCRSGGGWSECPMRKCCMQKRLEFCHECKQKPCQELLAFQRKHFMLPCPHYVKETEKNR